MQRSPAGTSRGSPTERSMKRMPQAAPASRPGAVGALDAARPRPSRAPLGLLALSAVALVVAQVAMPSGVRARAIFSSAYGAMAAAVAAVVVLQAARRGDAWRSTRRYGKTLLALALVQAGFLVAALVKPPVGPFGPGALVDLIPVGVVLLMRPLLWFELRDHFPRGDRREVLADIMLLAVASATLVFVVLRPDTTHPAMITFSAGLWAQPDVNRGGRLDRSRHVAAVPGSHRAEPVPGFPGRVGAGVRLRVAPRPVRAGRPARGAAPRPRRAVPGRAAVGRAPPGAAHPGPATDEMGTRPADRDRGGRGLRQPGLGGPDRTERLGQRAGDGGGHQPAGSRGNRARRDEPDHVDPRLRAGGEGAGRQAGG